MNRTCTNFIIFAVGTAIGSAFTWKYAEKKFKRIADDEIKSVKEMYGHHVSDKKDTGTKETTEMVEKSSIDKAMDIVKKEGYIQYSKRKEDETVKEPYVIPPDEFGEHDDYERESLTYYADGVLTDESDNVIDDVDWLIGKDSLDHFGEWEDDSVFVRNDKLKTDYEILADTREYADIFRK